MNLLSPTEQTIISTPAAKRSCHKCYINKKDQVVMKFSLNEEDYTYKMDIQLVVCGILEHGLIDWHSKNFEKISFTETIEDGIPLEKECFTSDFIPESPEFMIWAAEWFIKSKINLWAFDMSDSSKKLLQDYTKQIPSPSKNAA